METPGGGGCFIYTAGYHGRSSAGLKQLLEERDAVLVDIRLSPRSQFPEWQGAELRSLLGGRYLHVPELGNVNYAARGTAEIKIADMDAGLRIVLGVGKAVVLLCMCPRFERCHRRVVAEELLGRGYAVEDFGEW
jgi:uncharacterized protein (DUF488 family)